MPRQDSPTPISPCPARSNAELAAAEPDNISYLVLRLADNSFLHLSFHNHGDSDIGLSISASSRYCLRPAAPVEGLEVPASLREFRCAIAKNRSRQVIRRLRCFVTRLPAQPSSRRG